MEVVLATVFSREASVITLMLAILTGPMSIIHLLVLLVILVYSLVLVPMKLHLNSQQFTKQAFSR